MVYYVSVIYPRTESSTFDMDYYLSTHMPLVDKHWVKHGLQSWDIVELEDGPYSVQAILRFGAADEFKAASGSEDGKAVFGDVPKFSSEQPILVQGIQKAERK